MPLTKASSKHSVRSKVDARVWPVPECFRLRLSVPANLSAKSSAKLRAPWTSLGSRVVRTASLSSQTADAAAGCGTSFNDHTIFYSAPTVLPKRMAEAGK